MAIIQKGSKVFVNADAPITLFDGGEPTNPRSLPNGEGNVKDYYGDLKQVQQDLKFQPSSLIGVATGETIVYNSTLYYKILISNNVDKRTSHGWGAGTYEKVDWLGWASSADVTDNETTSLEKFNKRTDGATVAQVKTANASSNGIIATGSTILGGNGTTTSKNTILYVLGGLILAGLGYLFFRNK